jgi:hypothetical protein
MITFNSFNLSRLLSPQVAPVCLGGEPRGSNAFLNFFDHDKRGAELLRVTGRSRACGHGFLLLSASTKAQSSGQNGQNQNCFYKFQIISPPFAASCSTRSGSYGSNVFLPWFGCMIGKIVARTLQLATRNLDREFTPQLRPPCPHPRDRTVRLHPRSAFSRNRSYGGCRLCPRVWCRGCR